MKRININPPPYAGGQGRTAEEIEEIGAAMLWLLPLLVVLIIWSLFSGGRS
jgi:hypothetical protein